MPTDLVVRIVTAVASALDYAHKQGLLHRDVKPANIMLTHLDDDDDEQRILLADFGIARDIEDISGLTTTNMAVGTVAYSAPEQLMGEEIDGRADRDQLCPVLEEGIAVRLPLGLFWARTVASDVVLVHLRVFLALDRVNQVRVQTMLRQPVPPPHLVQRERDQQRPNVDRHCHLRMHIQRRGQQPERGED
jgi:serine/threonine protein kinase